MGESAGVSAESDDEQSTYEPVPDVPEPSCYETPLLLTTVSKVYLSARWLSVVKLGPRRFRFSHDGVAFGKVRLASIKAPRSGASAPLA